MEWIDVNKRLPEEDGEYLTYDMKYDLYYCDNFSVSIGVFLAAGNHQETVTHWYYLPDPPKRKKEA